MGKRHKKIKLIPENPFRGFFDNLYKEMGYSDEECVRLKELARKLRPGIEKIMHINSKK